MQTGNPATYSRRLVLAAAPLASGLRRRLAAAVWGGMQARHVALAGMLGVAAGFVTGPNLLLFAVIVAFVLFNAHVRTFLVCWAAAAATAFYLRDAAARIGGVFIQQTPLGNLLDRYADSTLVSLVGLHEPILCGGVALALLFSLGAARTLHSCMRDLVRSARGISFPEDGQPLEPLLSAAAPQDQVPPATRQWHEALSESQRVLARFFWGSLDEAPERMQRQGGWLRPFGWAFAALAACVLPYLPGWLGERELRSAWLPRLAESLGLHDVACKVEYNGWTGRLVARDVALARWPGEPPAVRLARLDAQLSPGRLLRSQLHAEKVVVQGMTLTSACACGADEIGAASPPSKARRGQVGGRIDLTSLLSASGELACGAGRLRALLEALAALSACEGTDHAADRPSQAAPRLYVRKLTLQMLPEEWRLGRHAVVSLGPVSSHQRLLGRPCRLKVTSPRHGLRLACTLNLHREPAVHGVRFEVDEQPLERLIVRPSGGVTIRRGEVSLSGSGQMEHDGLDVAVAVEMRGLDIECAPSCRLAGLDGRLCNELLEACRDLALSLRLAGPWHAPRIELTRSDLAKQLADQADRAGRRELKRRIRLALDPGGQPRRPAMVRDRLVQLAAAPAEPPGEPQAIATDEVSEPAAQAVCAPGDALGQVRSYPRTSTPDDEGLVIDQDPPAAEPSSGVDPLAKPSRALAEGLGPAAVGRQPFDQVSAHGADETRAERGPLPPEVPLPGPIGLTFGQDGEPPAVARPARVPPRPTRPPQPASVASYTPPVAAKARPSAAAPADYLSEPAATRSTSTSNGGKPKSAFSRWARGLVNKAFGKLPGARAADEAETNSEPAPAQREPAPAGAVSDESSCPFDEPEAQAELPWYRRLWR